MSLATKAVLAELHISAWYNRVSDLQAKAEIAEKHGIDNRDDQYIKRPLPKSAMKPIESLILKIRNYHNSMTYPWGAGGMRMLLSKNIFKYTQHMQDLKGALEVEVNALAEKLPDWKEVARAARKDTFREEDYPTPEVFRESFVVSTGFFELPTGDVRVVSGLEDAENVRAEISRHYENSLHAFGRELQERLIEMLNRLAISMTGKIFRKEAYHNLNEFLSEVELVGMSQHPLLKKGVLDARMLIDSNDILLLTNDPSARIMLSDTTKRVINELKSTKKGETGSTPHVQSLSVAVDSPV